MTAMGRRDFTRNVIGTLAASPFLTGSAGGAQASRPESRPSLTDVEGLLVGHHTLERRPTGCTVVTCRSAFTAGVDVRGGAPGTRETELLRAENTVQRVDAVVLSGGSAFGLDSATGVVKYLEEHGQGLDVQIVKVPIVCGAILFDLGLGDPMVRPDAQAGYMAAKAASENPVAEGNVGAGAGATVGKFFGASLAMKAGLGSWALQRPEGLQIGALVAVNCVGDVVDPSNGKIVAGARKQDGTGFVDTIAQLKNGSQRGKPFGNNTVLAVVATNAKLTKAQCNRVALMAQDGLARCVRPSHTPWDGDTVFAVATGKWEGGETAADAGLIGALAADVLSTAILRGVTQSQSWGSYPAARDFPKKG